MKENHERKRKKTTKVRTSVREKTLFILNYLFIAMTVVICLYPFLNVIAYSLSSNRAILSGWVTIFPMELQTNAYQNILQKSTIWQAMQITVLVTTAGTAIGLLLTICASYALSKKRLKGRFFLTMIILFTMYFGGGIIPTFLVIKGLGLLDTVWALILPNAMNAFNFIVMRTFFQQLPESLEEAAILDGCNELQILIRIVMPLSLPIIATIGLFYAVEYWNSYFEALMYISTPEKFTLQLKLRQLIFSEELNQISASAGIAGEGIGQTVMPESLKAASVVVATFPIILVYPWLQRYFVKGVMLGSVKG